MARYLTEVEPQRDGVGGVEECGRCPTPERRQGKWYGSLPKPQQMRGSAIREPMAPRSAVPNPNREETSRKVRTAIGLADAKSIAYPDVPQLQPKSGAYPDIGRAICGSYPRS